MPQPAAGASGSDADNVTPKASRGVPPPARLFPTPPPPLAIVRSMEKRFRFSLRALLLVAAAIAIAAYAASFVRGEFWAVLAVVSAGGFILGAPHLLVEMPIRAVHALRRWRSK